MNPVGWQLPSAPLRAILVALVAGLVGEPKEPAIAAAAVAASVAVTLLDGVDGWLARRNRIASRFGARFDIQIAALTLVMLPAIQPPASAWLAAAALAALSYSFLVDTLWLRRQPA